MKKSVEKLIAPINSSLRQVLEVIDRGALGTALLVDPESKKFVGLATDGDVRRALLQGCTFDDPVESLISKGKYVTVSTTTPFNEILDLFSPSVRIIPILNDAKRVVDIAVYDKRRFFPIAEPDIEEKEWKYVSDCVLSGWVSSAGSYVKRFEKIFAEFCWTKYAISTSSGTTALHLALLANGIGPGDEVIVPTLTFIATANAVLYTGATPVFAESEPTTWNIDPARIEELITARTRAIIPVHLYGHPVRMDELMKIARRHQLVVIEDAAEAHGALYKGKKVGGIGDTGVFSFFGNKIVTTGEGGMVVTNNKSVADKVKVLRDHGMDPDKRYWHTVLGYNYRLTNLQAALGVAQMERIEEILLRKRKNAEVYREVLGAVPGITVAGEQEWARNVFWLYSILIEPEEYGMSRDVLMECLRERGIETRPVFLPVHSQPVYAQDKQFPVAEYIAEHGLSLPSSSRLHKEEVKNLAGHLVELAAS